MDNNRNTTKLVTSEDPSPKKTRPDQEGNGQRRPAAKLRLSALETAEGNPETQPTSPRLADGTQVRLSGRSGQTERQVRSDRAAGQVRPSGRSSQTERQIRSD